MQPSITQVEQIKLEYDILMQEYNTLRVEIVGTLEAARQVTNYTLVLSAILVPSISLLGEHFVQAQSAVILLLIPFVFYFLAWIALRYVILTTSLSHYIRDHIAPEVRRCHAALTGDTGKSDTLLRWEDKGKNTLRQFGVFYLPIASSHLGFPILAAIVVLASYAVITSANNFPVHSADYMLIIANAGVLLYTIYWGLRLELSR
jgi:hypothetical protein